MLIKSLDSLLFPCDHCGCLVVTSALRLLRYEVDEGVWHSDLNCKDHVACEARRWSRQSAVRDGFDDIPLDTLEEGAPLFRCMGCDAARTAEEIVVAVVTDEEGQFTEMECKDSEQCILYQSSAEWRALQEMVSKRLDDPDEDI